jgi:hypothetical protein
MRQSLEKQVKKRISLSGALARLGLALQLCIPVPVESADWPDFYAPYTLDLVKTAGAEMTDPHWAHLHMHEADATSFSVGMNFQPQDAIYSSVQVRYKIHGVPVSGWLNHPFNFTIDINNPALSGVEDGIHDLDVDVQGANRSQIRSRPIFVHLHRHQAFSKLVPIIDRNGADQDRGSGFGPGVYYVNVNDRNFRAYPVDPSVTPWTQPPYDADLYQEEMAPHTSLFHSMQMWWEEPTPSPNQGEKFIRGFESKHAEDHRSLRVQHQHDRFPYKDGPRGIGWMSSYVSGQVDSTGGLAFAETGGRVGYLKPDGEIITVAGWRVQPNKEPVWPMKPSFEMIRRNMELRGQWINGQYTDGNPGFRMPLDVAIDPQNEKIWYVAGFEDHVIWKIEIIDMASNNVRVSVFAGDLNHQSGYQNGTGTAARFNGPASLVFDPVSDSLYVADQANDAIRKITRSGQVTTVFGSPGMAARLQQAGSGDVYNQLDNRTRSRFEVSAAQASSGIRPDIYKPQTVRVDSQGNIVLLELGYGAVRKLNPNTGEARKMAEVQQKFAEFDFGWAWLDVDRWGVTGPKDGIYWLKFVGENIDGESGRRFNEVYAWVPPQGGLSRFIFGPGWDPYPYGWGRISESNGPHYPWLVAVDPRGALYIAGAGEHGVTRLRIRKASDPVVGDALAYMAGEFLWRTGEAIGGKSLAFKFGWNGHNMLGYPDAWGYKGASDSQLISTFEIPAAITGDAQKRAQILNFLKLNSGSTMGPVPPPPPPPPPTTSRCDVNANGTTDVNDVQLCVNQTIGAAPCTNGDINLDSQCTVIDIQRVVNATLGGQCVSP